MTEEMKKRIDAEADKRATKLYPVTSIREMSKELVLQTVYDSGFKDSAKFILEMPEFDMIKSFLNFASIENASRREVSFHAKELLESLKKAGLV